MHYLDLGSEEPMTRDQMALDRDFKGRNILGITGIGSTPGITNVMLRYAKPKFDTIETVHVGFAWDSNMPKFVTPFSIDAIAWAFTERAKHLVNGAYIEQYPHECTISYYYKSIGKGKTQFAKHIEPITYYDYLKDKGVKNIARLASFPPHSYAALTTLIDLGFMDKEEIKIGNASIKPLDFTTEILRRIPVPEGYTEKENLFLKIFGTSGGQAKTVEMDCVANTLPGWEDATCNVDTGFPAAILAEMIVDGKISERGMFAPEYVIPPEEFFGELSKRKIAIYENGKKIN
jgi:lysine 6-dehydrogenase